MFIRSVAEGSAVHSAFTTKERGKNKFVIPTGEIMGLRPTQGNENRLKGTAFRPSVTITITPNGSAALPFVIPSISTCLRQVEGEMNSVHEVVIIAITPNGSATFTSRFQSRRDDLKVAQDVSPGNTP